MAMSRQGMLVKLRPSRPWRIGPPSGERDRVDLIYHSDTLYSAITHSMRLLGRLEYWLETTARAEGSSPIRFTSMYPYFGDTLYCTPPRHIWPPAPSVRVPYSGARFVPMSLVESIFAGKPLQDDRWNVDGASQCLVPSGKSGPFRVAVRRSAAVDRWTGASHPHETACIEFGPKSGLWFAVAFDDAFTRDQWSESLRGAIRLLADSGFGGERSRGWGRAHAPEFRDGVLPQMIYKGAAGASTVNWLLSLVVPAQGDDVEWDRGSYHATVRGGHIDSSSGSGAAKKLLTMVAEGSVLFANTLEGSAPDVAPDGFAHPVYRAGWAFSLAVPAEVPRQMETVTPAPMDAADAKEEAAQEELSDETGVPDDVEQESTDISHLDLDAPVGVDYATETEELPREIPTTDEELERLEMDDNGGPDDDVAPPLHDPGPMEPPFSEPSDMSPFDPDGVPGEGDDNDGEGEQPPGPNPDEKDPVE